MVVNVDTDLLVSGGSGVLDSLSKCKEPYEAVANAQCGDVASFASFKKTLNSFLSPIELKFPTKFLKMSIKNVSWFPLYQYKVGFLHTCPYITQS